MNQIAQKYIEELSLKKHPEGGYFKEVYRSNEQIEKNALPERYTGARSFFTSIYFLLYDNVFSSFHRIASDETWHFYDGSPVRIYLIEKSGILNEVVLGKMERFQFTIMEGTWFAAEVIENNSFSLVGCTVAPGFDFNDFELGKRQKLSVEFPEYRSLINRFTND